MPQIIMKLGDHEVRLNLTDAQLQNDDETIVREWIAPATRALLSGAFPGRSQAATEALLALLREAEDDES
jgi:hypothetical protein